MDLSEPTNSGKRYSWISSIGVIVVVLGLLFYWYYWRVPNYVIPDVPYFGIYIGNILANDSETSVGMLLRYWGDERTDLNDIISEFPSVDTLENERSAFVTFERLKTFFDKQGYQTEIRKFNNIRDFAEFINPRVKTPLIILRHLSDRSDLPPLPVFSVLVGIEGRELIIHDNIYGNNYRLGFDDFNKLTSGLQHRFLVVQPSPAIAGELKPKRTGQSYPARLGIMDSKDNIDLNLRWAAMSISAIQGGNNPSASRDRWRAIVEHSAFEGLHPAGRITAYVYLAKFERELGNYNRAIEIIEKFAIPLNHDLNKPYQEWGRDPAFPSQFTSPWLSLARTYIATNQLEKAGMMIAKAVQINASDPLVQFVKNELKVKKGL